MQARRRRFKRISLKKTVPDDHRVLEVRVEEFTHSMGGESFNVTLTLRAHGEDAEESWSLACKADPELVPGIAEDRTRHVGRATAIHNSVPTWSVRR